MAEELSLLNLSETPDGHVSEKMTTESTVFNKGSQEDQGFDTYEYVDPEERRREMLKDPSVQAQIVYQNYINTSNRILSGKDKRKIRREIERNVLKGKYKKLFDQDIYGSAFSKLNSPS